MQLSAVGWVSARKRGGGVVVVVWGGEGGSVGALGWGGGGGPCGLCGRLVRCMARTWP